MNFINSTQAYGRPISNIGVRQQLRARDCFDLPGGILLWKTSAKVALVIIVVAASVNMLLASLVGNVETSIARAESVQRELTVKHEVLSSYQEELWSEKNITDLAGRKLELFAASGNQIKYL